MRKQLNGLGLKDAHFEGCEFVKLFTQLVHLLAHNEKVCLKNCRIFRRPSLVVLALHLLCVFHATLFVEHVVNSDTEPTQTLLKKLFARYVEEVVVELRECWVNVLC